MLSRLWTADSDTVPLHRTRSLLPAATVFGNSPRKRPWSRSAGFCAPRMATTAYPNISATRRCLETQPARNEAQESAVCLRDDARNGEGRSLRYSCVISTEADSLIVCAVGRPAVLRHEQNCFKAFLRCYSRFRAEGPAHHSLGPSPRRTQERQQRAESPTQRSGLSRWAKALVHVYEASSLLSFPKPGSPASAVARWGWAGNLRLFLLSSVFTPSRNPL